MASKSISLKAFDYHLLSDFARKCGKSRRQVIHELLLKLPIVVGTEVK